MNHQMSLRFAVSVCTAALLLLLSACGGGGGNSNTASGGNTGGAGNAGGNAGGSGSNTNVVGATSQAACESAAQRDAPACFVVSGTQARMYGVLGSNSPATVRNLINNHRNVTEIVMIDVPGSEDDTQNLVAARAVNTARLNTRLEANSNIASGGVDFFLAGVRRVIASGATIGVHSWAGNNVEGASFPRNHPNHRPYLDYYAAIGFANGEQFYFFTLAAAPSRGIHNMTAAEIRRFGLATPVSQSVTASVQEVRVSPGKRLGKHRVSVSQDNTVYVKGDSADTTFLPGTGVSHIDGGKGTDTAVFDGARSEYTINVADGKTTVIDSDYSRNGIAVLTNIENLTFKGE